ncbi:MAG: Rnase Y domain-containing protein, partial [Mailhella sp.]|nr:Rnase Y domain-containing protein [Mailhella sp.]
MYIISLSVSIILTAIVGIVAGCFIQNRVTAKRLGDAKDLATRIINEARKEASAQKKELLVQCQDEILQQKKAMEIEYREQEREIKNRERKLQDLTERLDEKIERVTKKEDEIIAFEKEQAAKERQLTEKEAELQNLMDEQERKLQEVCGLTVEEAKARLFQEIEARTRHEAAHIIRVIETEAKENADRKAKEIIAGAIQRYAGDYVGEQTVTAVPLPSEDMKG